MIPRNRQSGLTYVEVLVATVLLAIMLVPALQALGTGVLGSEVHASMVEERYAVLSRMEEVLAEPHSMLTAAAGAAGSYKNPTSYSDAGGTPSRRVVYVGLYDADDADGDGNVYTVPDPNLDGDFNPYTGYTGLLWVRVELEGSVIGLETLTAR